MRKVRVYLYPEATPHLSDTGEADLYFNTVPFSQKGLEEHTEIVEPKDAEFFYMGQFHYNDVKQDGFRLERFPYLEEYPKKHIADISGDWDFRYLDPIFLRCILTMAVHDRSLPNKKICVYPHNSRLHRSMLSRQDRFEFTPDRARLGFRGSIHHHWVRLLLYAYTLKWEMPCNWTHHIFGFGNVDPKGPETKEYEQYMFQHGLALCPRGVPDGSVRFYESCFYNCVPIIVGNHGTAGDDYYDTSFIWQVHPEASEIEMFRSFQRLLSTPFEELKYRADSARDYFDNVVRVYFQDPTAFFLRFLIRHNLWAV